MNKGYFWSWIFVNAFSSTLLIISPVFLVTSFSRVNTLIPWGAGAFYLLPLISLTFLLATIILPGIILKFIDSRVHFWLYMVSMFFYVLIWCLLMYISEHFNGYYRLGTWRAVEIAIEAIQHNLHRDFDLSYPMLTTVGSALIWPFLCYAPMVIFFFLREKEWIFPLQLGAAMSAASIVSGITGLIFSHLFFDSWESQKFAPNGFDDLDLRDLLIILHWSLAAASGAAVSYGVLSTNPARHSRYASRIL